MLGYSSNEEATRESFIHGWFKTGDMGKMDADGFLFITGRSKDVINRGGELPTRPTQLDSALVRTASDVHSWPLTKHHVAAVWQL